MKRFLKKIFRLSRDLFRVSIQMIAKFFRFAVGQLLLEVFLAVFILGFSYLFSSWGLPLHFALVLAIAVTLSLAVLATYLFFELDSFSRPKGEIKLAQRIGQTLTNKTSTEWNEYQDWLHDILLARRQLLNARCPRWKVKLITYRRLGVFCIVVGVSKVKQVATEVWRSR